MNKNIPIISVKTSDGLDLCGVLLEPEAKSKTIVIYIHGTAASLNWTAFYEPLANSALKQGYAFLSSNNRGSGVYELEKGTIPHGASLEKFEDCLLDIDAWMEYCMGLGYEQFILLGHSFGTEKILYYMQAGKYKEKVLALALFGFCDTVGTQQKYERKIGHNYIEESKQLISAGKSEQLISDLYGLAGEIPISAQTYISFFSENSKLSKVLPLRNGKNLENFKKVNIPILAVIGDMEENEYTIMPIKEAMELLKKENKYVETFQISNSNHCYNGREVELASIFEDFLKRRFSN